MFLIYIYTHTHIYIYIYILKRVFVLELIGCVSTQIGSITGLPLSPVIMNVIDNAFINVPIRVNTGVVDVTAIDVYVYYDTRYVMVVNASQGVDWLSGIFLANTAASGCSRLF